jgi:hypothetical protein
LAFLDRVRDWLGPRPARRTGRKFWFGSAGAVGQSAGEFDQSLGPGLIEGEAAEEAIAATDDPAEQEREEFGTEL